MSADGTSQSDFAHFAGRYLTERIVPKLVEKGQSYRGADPDDPAWANILAMAHLTRISPRQVILVMMSKHFYALCQWAQGQELPDAADRIADLIIFSLLLLFMSLQMRLIPSGAAWEGNTVKEEDKC